MDNVNETSKEEEKRDQPCSPRNEEESNFWIEKKLREMHQEFHKTREDILSSEPEPKDFFPYCWNSLLSYTTTDIIDYVCHKSQEDTPHGYCQRRTAIQIVDPEVSWKMDNILYLSDQLLFHTPRAEKEDTTREQEQLLAKEEDDERFREEGEKVTDEKDQSSEQKEDEETVEEKPFHQPRFKHMKVDRLKVQKKDKYKMNGLDWTDLVSLREELKQKYSSGAKASMEKDYKVAQKDWQEMGLNSFGDVQDPVLRKTAYYASLAYLGTKPGSLQATKEKTRKVLPDVVDQLENPKTEKIRKEKQPPAKE